MVNMTFWHTKMIMPLIELQNTINLEACYYVIEKIKIVTNYLFYCVFYHNYVFIMYVMKLKNVLLTIVITKVQGDIFVLF